MSAIFSEFEGYIDPASAQGSGDVKYHLGATGNYKTKSDKEINCIRCVKSVPPGICKSGS